MEFYGHYKSSLVSVNGCVKEFSTVAQDTNIFPGNVIRHCDLCNKEHRFYLKNWWRSTSPAQKKRFDDFMTRLGVEQEVKI